MSYKYENPLDIGYRRVRFSRKDHQRLFPRRPLKWHNSFEYYLSDTDFLVHRFVSLPAVALNTLMFPVALLVYGIANFKEVWRDHAGMVRQKHYGSFSSEKVWARSEPFAEIVRAARPC